MQQSPIRTALRNATGAAHQALDSAVGEFDDLTSYKRYVRGLYAFRAPLERQVAAYLPEKFSGWSPSQIAADLAQDLDDLHAEAPLSTPITTALSPSQLMGALYVLEGSTLGARILCGRAAALGLSPTYGARHLWKQAGGLENWRAFLAIMESANDLDIEATISGANDAFAAARNAMEQV